MENEKQNLHLEVKSSWADEFSYKPFGDQYSLVEDKGFINNRGGVFHTVPLGTGILIQY